jgi:spermidine synthase
LRNLIFGLLLLQLACLAFSGSIDAAARRAFWRAFSPELTLVGSRESPYGNIAILKSGNTPKESLTAKGTGQFNVYQSGRLVCSLPDRGEAAPLAHLCMVQRQSPPRRILLIGGGFAGMLKEILKHPVQTVDYVEIDPLLIRVAWQFSGAQDRKALEDRRVRIHHVDGRAFVRRNRERYDLILVNAPEPVTTQSNRFFTREFFQNIRQRLNEDGIFCLGAVTSEPLYQGEDILRRNGSIYATLRNVFPQVLITPGNPCYFLASAGTDAPTLESAIVLKRLTDRGIKSTDIFPLVEDFYVRKVNYELRTGRSYDALGTSTTPAPDAIRPLNTDLRPIVYYYSIQVWSRIVGDRTFVGVRRLENAGIGLLAALLLGAGWWGWRTTVKDGSGAGRLQVVAAGMLACGLTGMVMEMMTILAFQNTVGSIYQSVGVLVALFMLGLACGARWALTRAPSQRAGFSFAMVQTTLTIFALATPFLLQSLEGLELSVAEAFAYGALNLIAGALVGCAFPLGVALTGDGNDSKAALLYAADLLGGCLGALVISPWLLPRWGLATVALLCAGLNGIATIWAWKTVGVEKAAT